MLYRTFLHLPGCGEQGERYLWQQGIEDWWDLLAARSLHGFSPWRLKQAKTVLQQSIALKEDLVAMGNLIPKRHHWRLYKRFKERALFLDIETNGLSRQQSAITVIGLAKKGIYRAFVAHENLEEALPIINSSSMIITFGGAQFDLPFLQAKYPWLSPPPIHLDLCPLLRRLGLKGGLKRIEKALGLARPEEVAQMDGYQAVLLWKKWRKGKTKALEKLLKYNREDVLNLMYLADIAYQGLMQFTLTGKVAALTVSCGK